MDPKVLFLLPGLATCPTSHAQASWHSLTPPAMPVYVWPERQELPEKDHPAHGEGSGESRMFVGVATNASGRVVVDSSASGSAFSNGTHALDQTTWLPIGLNVVTSRDDLDVEPFLPTTRPIATIQFKPDTTKHLSNPSTTRARRSYTRRRG